jgi:hypothetical protein
MDRTVRSWLAGALALSALSLSGGASAAKPEDLKQQCVEAYEQTQSLRKSASLRSARASALTCAQAGCPAVVKKDCASWLTELDQSLPSVVLSARDKSGQETTAVRVFVDNEPLVERLDGRSVALDPGAHTLRFELDGAPPSELRTLIREGEKNRPIEISFAPAAPPSGPGAASSSPPIAVFVFGGIGVLALGSFATFALLGKSQKSDLEKSCAPTCTDEEVGRVRTKLLIGDISLVTGIVALGAATTFFFLDHRAPAAAPPPHASVHFDLHPLPGGGAAALGGSF